MRENKPFNKTSWKLKSNFSLQICSSATRALNTMTDIDVRHWHRLVDGCDLLPQPTHLKWSKEIFTTPGEQIVHGNEIKDKPTDNLGITANVIPCLWPSKWLLRNEWGMHYVFKTLTSVLMLKVYWFIPRFIFYLFP